MSNLSKSDKKFVERLIKNRIPANGYKHEYREVQANRFRHLDKRFYENTQSKAENIGFRFVCDIEDVTLKSKKPDPRTFIRVMTHEQENSICAFYHVKPYFPWNLFFLLKSAKPTRITEFETFFDDESIVISSNTPKWGREKFDNKIYSSFYDNITFIELYEHHVENIKLHLEKFPHINAIPQLTTNDVIYYQNKQEETKYHYWKSLAWVKKSDLMKGAANDKALVWKMINYARELEGLASHDHVELQKAEKIIKPFLTNTALEFREKTILPIDDTDEVAWVIKTSDKLAVDDWKMLKKIQKHTHRYPVVTCLWQKNDNNDTDSWKNSVKNAELFDRSDYHDEANQTEIDVSPHAIISRADNIDTDELINELIEQHNSETFPKINESLEKHLEYFKLAHPNIMNIEDKINKIRQNILSQINLGQIKGEIDLQNQLDKLEVDLWSNEKFQLPYNPAFADENHKVWHEPKDMYMAIVLLPCEHSWQVPAYLHWHGSIGFNSETICALLKLWYEKYSIELIYHYGTMLQLEANKNPKTMNEALKLASLQNIIAPDTINPIGINIRDYAIELLHNEKWFLHSRF